MICFLCGKYGYEKEGCVHLIRLNATKTQTPVEKPQDKDAEKIGGENVRQNEKVVSEAVGEEGHYGP